jgi:formimidoylglutamate deiminase
MNEPAQVIEADLTWIDGRFEAGVMVTVGEDGRIAQVDRAGETGPGDAGPAVGSPASAGLPRRRLAGRALVPGFVDAHSHAFQRGLRGRGESFPEGAGSFWTWREAMYSLVAELDPERLRTLSLQAFGEMRAAGVTTVGEFHYLHHADAEARDWAFDEAVLEAAAEAGVRLVLLQAFYAAGGIGRPLEGAQRRFATPSAEEYWRQLERLEGLLAPGLQTLGVVAHSLRAVPLPGVVALYAEARRRGLRMHLHVEEQRREIEEVREAYGRGPLALLNDELEVSAALTAVHCTHSEPAELERWVAAGGHVCVCPLTEANLGDGIPPLAATQATHGRLCLGTDSNARLSMLEEMRWLEYGQRLAGERRGVIAETVGGRVAPALLAAATVQGARSLGVDAGEIAAGAWADFATVDLGHPSLAGTDPDTLPEALVFGAADGAIAATCVGGRWPS